MHFEDLIAKLKGKSLTKYFKEADLKHFKAGNIRFGTLQQYREAERNQDLGARGDAGDGHKRRYLEKWENGGIAFDRVEHNNYTNAWVFCGTLVEYSQDHHFLMRDGDPNTGYAGSKELTHACQFDLAELFNALFISLPEQKKFDAFDGRQYLHFGEVSYLPETENVANPADLNRKPQNDEELVSMVLKKDPIFSTEQEFRFILNIKLAGTLPNDAAAMDVKSDRISEAIVSYHQIPTL